MRGGLFQMMEDLVTFWRGSSKRTIATVTILDASKTVQDGRAAMIADPQPSDKERLPVATGPLVDNGPSVFAIHLAGSLDSAAAPTFVTLNADLPQSDVFVALDTPATNTDRTAKQAIAGSYTASQVLQRYTEQADETRRLSLPYNPPPNW